MMTTHSPDDLPPPRLGGSHYITRETARRAVDMAAPMIEAGMHNQRIVGSGFLYVVVMDPGRPPTEASFEEAILYEHAFGDRGRWDADYAAFARAKARLSWLAGMDTHRMQSMFPHLLHSGDTLLWGSVWLDGIVVGASGAFPWYDEVYAGVVALCLRALAKEAHELDSGRTVLEPPLSNPQAPAG
jgi:hypothetical protein